MAINHKKLKKLKKSMHNINGPRMNHNKDDELDDQCDKIEEQALRIRDLEGEN